MSHPLSPS